MTNGDDLTVLCVDPEPTTAAALSEQAGFEVYEADSIDAAVETAPTGDIDCVVAEYELSDGTGFELFESVREQSPNAACILYTDSDRSELETAAVQETVAEFFPKDTIDDDRLAAMVRDAVVNRTQVGFPLPENEDERLDALAEYDVGAFDAQETFDRLSELVATQFDIAVAFVGLVHEVEERFIACHGADWESLPREDSICTYAVLDDDVTVIENVQDDPRFEHNETLRQLDIRSYAGANITAPDGTVIGELCLIHDEPRSYTTAERRTLQLFADEVSEQLTLRRKLAEREENQ